ncbi:transcriptional regulator [Xaviernesmea oryzae]|uniref:HTH-type transcriptional regulator TtuA n=1 Tax=Xaviernesmea oryzae TaxID=464029 RepID=A0A1Q9AYU7_9HYPH|nr:LysR family transcriptional regulator [Xaviernesmea oryzae]OLP60873.1 transcriptional regulator [Xaviernesmea oryzae]SEL23358.1 DNA-binding transcriptional regulator, LysR family [Xaviernesmea oryzae]
MKIFSENTNIGLRHFRAAVTVMEEGSFSRAADRLGVVPSALTETVRALEAECGTRIFDRASRPVRPTEDGRRFLDHARDVLDRFELSLHGLRQIGALQTGRVTIGAAPSSVQDYLADALARFCQDYPGVDVVIHDDVAERLAAMVADRRLDFALAGQTAGSSTLQAREIGADRFGLVCHCDHPLAKPGRVLRLADLPEGAMIALEGQTGIARLLADHPDLPPALLKGRIRTYSTIAQLTLVHRNLGIALLPERAAAVLQSDQIVFRLIDDLTLTRSIYLLTPFRTALSRAAERFIECLPAA